LDLTTQITALNRISVQARFRLGDMGRAAKAAKVDELYTAGVEAYARGNVEHAVSLWKEVIALDPSFDPAREAIRTAQAFIQLRDDVRDIRVLNP
ncbi:MAG TPA: hypothetical protein VLH39_08015, partial [Magnetospirillaceae bacterium]|nr:hypothetical protein [Magnetospirillaceae bacterium]